MRSWINKYIWGSALYRWSRHRKCEQLKFDQTIFLAHHEWWFTGNFSSKGPAFQVGSLYVLFSQKDSWIFPLRFGHLLRAVVCNFPDVQQVVRLVLWWKHFPLPSKRPHCAERLHLGQHPLAISVPTTGPVSSAFEGRVTPWTSWEGPNRKICAITCTIPQSQDVDTLFNNMISYF